MGKDVSAPNLRVRLSGGDSGALAQRDSDDDRKDTLAVFGDEVDI
jgi:hypothetical protein